MASILLESAKIRCEKRETKKPREIRVEQREQREEKKNRLNQAKRVRTATKKSDCREMRAKFEISILLHIHIDQWNPTCTRLKVSSNSQRLHLTAISPSFESCRKHIGRSASRLHSKKILFFASPQFFDHFSPQEINKYVVRSKYNKQRFSISSLLFKNWQLQSFQK